MINHRGTLMKMSDYLKLGCPDKIRRNTKGEYVTQPFNDYMGNLMCGIASMMDPAGFQRRLHTDAKFREANMKWYEEEKARRERGEKQWMDSSSDSDEEVEEKVEPVDPEAQRLAEKRKKRNQMTRDKKKEKKRLLKEQEALKEGSSS
ncbi:hypothetical protein CAEBREN_14853 [Caenorhabditis brenneri]|uniref:Uncharacterized protein n=1 Tax=Caenorhabditis brenneri TaxID=135651 RepID=G0N2W4_CAEBE|nr:hypothetical protein CAEBREN_14853 [Caenorhabditis brenneri]